MENPPLTNADYYTDDPVYGTEDEVFLLRRSGELTRLKKAVERGFRRFAAKRGMPTHDYKYSCRFGRGVSTPFPLVRKSDHQPQTL